MGEWSSCRRRTMMNQKESGRPARTPKSRYFYSSVPSWEVQFCSQISWAKFCEDKKLTHLFQNVLDWDDSAGKESFDNAKARFWAELNGLQYNIASPNPDLYIDVVNQDTYLDPRLVEDLYESPPPPRRDIQDYSSIEITPTGWDVENPASGGTVPAFISAGNHQIGNVNSAQIPKTLETEHLTITPTGWGDAEEINRKGAARFDGRDFSSWDYVECRNRKGGRLV